MGSFVARFVAVDQTGGGPGYGYGAEIEPCELIRYVDPEMHPDGFKKRKQPRKPQKPQATKKTKNTKNKKPQKPLKKQNPKTHEHVDSTLSKILE